VFDRATALYERAQNWAIGSDPGLLRLRMAARTTVSLAVALLILFLLTKAAHQPLTVALLGVLITMVAGRAVNEPDPYQQKITIVLLPLPAALAITTAVLLAPHKLVADVVFVVIVYAAVYARRFGARGRALGMVAFMAYFFTLYLRAATAELPWLIGAVLVGTVCSFVMTAFVLPDKPEGVLRATVRSLRARMAIVIDTTAEAVEDGWIDERRRRRLRLRTAALNETALMVQNQIEEKVNPAALWRGGPGPVAVRRRTHRRAGRHRRGASRDRQRRDTRVDPRRPGRGPFPTLQGNSRAATGGVGAGRTPGPGAARSPVNLQRRPRGPPPRPRDNRHGNSDFRSPRTGRAGCLRNFCGCDLRRRRVR
jgi:hypothetical protein